MHMLAFPGRPYHIDSNPSPPRAPRAKAEDKTYSYIYSYERVNGRYQFIINNEGKAQSQLLKIYYIIQSINIFYVKFDIIFWQWFKDKSGCLCYQISYQYLLNKYEKKESLFNVLSCLGIIYFDYRYYGL